MKLTIALFVLNLLGCAAGATQQAPSHAGSSQPSIVRDGGATTNTGSGSGGTPIPLPHPNV